MFEFIFFCFQKSQDVEACQDPGECQRFVNNEQPILSDIINNNQKITICDKEYQ